MNRAVVLVARALAQGTPCRVDTFVDAPAGGDPLRHGLIRSDRRAQLVDFGMKPIDALKAGTSLDAELLGRADRLGTLEPGKVADIVACPGNPEENIRRVEKIAFVMKEEVVYRRDPGK